MLSDEYYLNLGDEWILWLGVNISSEKIAQSILFSRTCRHKYFDDEKQCEYYIVRHVSEDDSVDVILGGAKNYSEQLSRIHDLRQVSSVYVLCSDATSYSKYAKVRHTCKDIDDLISKFETDKSNAMAWNISTGMAFQTFNIDQNKTTETSSSDMNADFLHSLLVIDVLLRMERSGSELNMELIDLCKKTYVNNQRLHQDIENFAYCYRSDQAIWWYTRDTFLYRMLNKAFRINNTYLLFLLHDYIRDLHDQIKEHQCTSTITVYRAQFLSSEETMHFQKCIGQYISMNSFLSTTVDRHAAVFMLGSSHSVTENLQRILFEITADPNIEGIKPFAKIAQLSAFPNENEVLFMARCIFRVTDVFIDDEDQVHIVRMTLSGDKANHLNAVFEQNKKNYGGGKQKQTNIMTLGNVLQRMGDLDKAEIFYRRHLNKSQDVDMTDPSIATCFFNMGEVLREKQNYSDSLLWYQQSLDVDLRRLGSDHPNIGNTYNSIGIVEEKMGDYENALDSYSIALKINLKSYGWNNTRVALCLNNTGNAYQAIGDFLTSLDCHKIALKIREKNLPPNHHRLAASHNNIGAVYHCIGHFDLALDHYQMALRINQKSLPKEHSDIMDVQRNICLLHESQTNLNKALLGLEEELKRRKTFLQTSDCRIIELEQDIYRIESKTDLAVD